MTPRILILPENTRGRDFVVGDIHGAFDMLDRALAAAKFDPEKDRVISVGDLIDRGPQSARCVEFLQQPWFFALRGNHEDMFLSLFENGKLNRDLAAANIRNGMEWVLHADDAILQEIRTALEKLPLVIETKTARGTAGFVHADVPEGMDWDTFKRHIEAEDEKTINTALWSRKRVREQDEDGVIGIGRVFFGHTPQEGARRLGNCFYVDTGAVFRMLQGGLAPSLSLTFCNVMARTENFAPQQKTQDINVITDLPQPPKPFGPYAAPRRKK